MKARLSSARFGMAAPACSSSKSMAQGVALKVWGCASTIPNPTNEASIGPAAARVPCLSPRSVSSKMGAASFWITNHLTIELSLLVIAFRTSLRIRAVLNRPSRVTGAGPGKRIGFLHSLGRKMKLTKRTEFRRLPGRGSHELETINAILDAGFLAHVGFCVDNQPYVIPTLYGRDGEKLYLHGSAASRMLGRLETGILGCIAVTLVDGLVLARSAFHHSMNYRSVV